MPAVTTTGNTQRNEIMWQALKRHIMRERQRKKQEQEADAEEERQRKERERQQKQDVMTIGETRNQILSLEAELSALKDEKHQLFLQLKKVLNEDDNRRRQKDASIPSEVLTTVNNYPPSGSNVVHQQMFLPLPTRSPLYKVTTATPTHTLIPTGSVKRSRTPSPPPAVYSSVYGYKPPMTMPNYNQGMTRELRGDGCIFPESEEAARRTGDSRAVLWTKSNQYPPTTFYSAPSGQGVQYSYATPTSQQNRENDPGKPVYLSGGRSNLSTHQAAYVTNLHTLEHKSPYPEDKFYLRPGSHVTVHGGAIPIQQPPQGAKTGSITSGYPVRAPQPPPPPPPPTAYSHQPPGTYVSPQPGNMPGRLLYSQPGARYMQRDP